MTKEILEEFRILFRRILIIFKFEAKIMHRFLHSLFALVSLKNR